MGIALGGEAETPDGLASATARRLGAEEVAAGGALRFGWEGGGGCEGYFCWVGFGGHGRIRRRRFGEGGLGIAFGEAGRFRLN